MGAERDDAVVTEELALGFEAMGLPRMAGRILGRLVLSEAPYESLDSLAAQLGASKGSMSTMARLLAQLGVVERVAVPGERRDHYRLRPGGWGELNGDRLAGLRRLRMAAEAAQRAGPAPSPTPDGGDVGEARQRHAHLEALSRWCAYFERELTELNRRYEEAFRASP